MFIRISNLYIRNLYISSQYFIIIRIILYRIETIETKFQNLFLVAKIRATWNVQPPHLPRYYNTRITL